MNVAFTPSLRIKWDSIPTESLEHKLKGLMTFDGVATVVRPSQCVELAVQLRLIHAACSLQSASRQSACLPASAAREAYRVEWTKYKSLVVNCPEP